MYRRFREKKVEEALRRGVGLLGGGIKEQVLLFLSPVNIGITVGSLVAWAAAHIYGVGEAVDLLVLVAGVGFIGWGFWDGFRRLVDFAATALQAQSELDLNRAALLFRDAVLQLGVNTLLTLLLKRPLAGALTKPGRITRINWTPKLQLLKQPPPLASEVSIELVNPSELKPGQVGGTDPYGNIRIANNLSFREQMKTGWHEEVHSWLAPKARLLRHYRTTLAKRAYDNSVFLRYLEEAAAEIRSLIMESCTFAGGNGLTRANLIKGIKFPLASGDYAILSRVPRTQETLVHSDIRTQGHILGSIMVDGYEFNVYLLHRSHHDGQQK